MKMTQKSIVVILFLFCFSSLKSESYWFRFKQATHSFGGYLIEKKKTVIKSASETVAEAVLQKFIKRYEIPVLLASALIIFGLGYWLYNKNKKRKTTTRNNIVKAIPTKTYIILVQ